jgi:hypothetical protein
MSRESGNVVIGGRLIDGYDYKNQAWVKDGVYQDCGHPYQISGMMYNRPCGCFGRRNKGIQTGAGFSA